MRVIAKKTTALLLSLMMVLMCIPASAFTVYATSIDDFVIDDYTITGYIGSDDIIDIPDDDNIWFIGEGAFENNEVVKEVTIHGNIYVIDDSAFYNSAVNKVTFTDDIPATISSYAFCNSTGEKEILFYCNPDKAEGLKNDLKASCNGMRDYYKKWKVNDELIEKESSGGETTTPLFETKEVIGGVEITSVDEKQVPASGEFKINIEDKTIVGIGARAFKGKITSGAVTVTLPDTLKYIGDEAFSGCYGLNSINLSKGLKTIGESAFYSCYNLGNIEFPDSLDTISKAAFQYCNSMTAVSIPDNTEIALESSSNVFSFAMCSGIESFNVADGNETLSAVDGVLFNADKTKLLAYPLGKADEKYTVPEGTLTIGHSAFKQTTAALPAFSNLKKCALRELVIANSVTSIENNAFQAQQFTDVSVPAIADLGTGLFNLATIDNITINKGVEVIPDGFFNGTKMKGTIKLPSTLKKIGNNAFDRLTQTSIELPEGLVEIGNEAFEYSSLTSITIPSTVTKVGDRAFYGCKDLTAITVADGDDDLDLGNYTFNQCKKLNNVVLPARVKTLGDGVFSVCTSLENIEMKGVTKLGNTTFYGCEALTEMNMPDTIKEIGNGTFMLCSNLKKVTLPANLAKWGSCTFECCSSLTEVTIPDTVTVNSVPIDTFYNCINLAELTLPKSIVRTEPCAFSKCEKLTKIIVKNTSGNFKRSAFDCYDINGEGLSGEWTYDNDGNKIYSYDLDKDPDGITSEGSGGCCGGANKGTLTNKASSKPEWNYEQTAAGGGTVTPDTDKKAAVTVTDTKTETVKNEQGEELSKITATVSEKVAEKLVNEAVLNKSGTVEITVKSDSANKADQIELEIPKKAVESLAKDTEADLVIKTDNGQVTLDNRTLETIAAEADGDTVKIVVNENTQLKETQKPASDVIGKNGKLFNIKAVIGSKYIHDFKGGKAHVTLPVPEKLKGKDIAIIYIDDKGICEILNHAVETVGTEEYIKFTTSHFSNFAVVEKADAEKIIEQQNKDKVNTLIKEVTLKVKTSKTSKKNIKAVVSGDVKALTDAGYTVKYKFYRSTKKASKYASVKTKDTNTYINSKGKKGTKYYYKAKVLVYDGDKLLGQTALTQCKYGVRTWSK